MQTKRALVALFCVLSGSAQACMMFHGISEEMFQRSELLFRGEPTAYLNEPRSMARFRVLETYRGPARTEWWLLMPVGTRATPAKVAPKEGYIVAARQTDNGFQIYDEPCTPMMVLPVQRESMTLLRKHSTKSH